MFCLTNHCHKSSPKKAAHGVQQTRKSIHRESHSIHSQWPKSLPSLSRQDQHCQANTDVDGEVNYQVAVTTAVTKPHQARGSLQGTPMDLYPRISGHTERDKTNTDVGYVVRVDTL